MLKLILTIVLTIILFAGSFALLLLIPFKNKKAQKIITIIGIAFALVMLVLPASVICDFNIPFINKSGYQIIEEFLNTSAQFKDVNALAPGYYETMVVMIENVIKSAVVFFVEGLVLFFSSIVLWIVYLVKKDKNKKKVRATFASFGCFILSLVFLLVPVYSIANIYGSLDNAMRAEGKPFYEEFPEYRAYTPIFKAIEALVPYASGDIVAAEVPLWVLDSFSYGDASRMSEGLASVDTLMYHFKLSGIPVIYDNNFDFSQTKKGTFDFEQLELLIKLCLESELFEPVSRGFTNHIMDSFEKTLDKENSVGDLQLDFSKEEFALQYKDIMDMLDFVVDYDLVNLMNLDFSKSEAIGKLKDVAKILASDTSRILKIIDYPFIQKAKQYVGKSTNIETAIYVCVKLYDAMNDWLEFYRTTSLYKTSYRFLTTKGVM